MLDSSPIGEPRASLPPLGVVRRTALAAPSGGGASHSPRCPLWGKCREAAKGVTPVTLSCCHSTNHTPSVSLCSTAPPLGSQGPRCPLWGKCREAAKGVSLVTLSCCYSTNYTPSVSLAGAEVPSSLPAPPPGSRGIVRICPRFHKTVGACRETLLRLAKSRLTAVARLHSACASLSQPLWAASSPIGEPRASLPPLGVVRRTALAAPSGGSAAKRQRGCRWSF